VLPAISFWKIWCKHFMTCGLAAARFWAIVRSSLMGIPAAWPARREPNQDRRRRSMQGGASEPRHGACTFPRAPGFGILPTMNRRSSGRGALSPLLALGLAALLAPATAGAITE